MRMITRWLRRGFILPAAAACALSVPISAAQAALVTYSFTGDINIAGNPSVSGSFQFDNATGGSGGVYNGAVTGFTLNLNFNTGTYTSSFAPGANAVTISQNMPLGGGIVDRWALVTAGTGEAISGTTTPFNFDLRLDQKGGGLFTDASLQNPPSLSSLNGGRAQWRLFFEDVDGNPSVYLGSISSLTAVPLPAAVLLFGAGLISLVGLGAGGLRNLRASKT